MITLGKKLLQRGFGNHPLFGVILLLFNMVGVGWFAHLAYQQCNFPPSGGGGFPVTTNVTVNNGGSITVLPGSTGLIAATTTAQLTNANAISPAGPPYNITFDGQACWGTNGVTFLNSSQTITAIGNCSFTPAM